MDNPTWFVRRWLLSAALLVAMTAQAQVPQRPAPSQPPLVADEPTVVGVARPWNGGFLGLAVEGNAFVLRFYDAEKHPVQPTAERAAVRWNPTNRAGTERTVLNVMGDPLSLRSPSIVRPPLVFTAFVTLLSSAGDAQGTMAFDLRELREAETP